MLLEHSIFYLQNINRTIYYLIRQLTVYCFICLFERIGYLFTCILMYLRITVKNINLYFKCIGFFFLPGHLALVTYEFKFWIFEDGCIFCFLIRVLLDTFSFLLCSYAVYDSSFQNLFLRCSSYLNGNLGMKYHYFSVTFY